MTKSHEEESDNKENVEKSSEEDAEILWVTDFEEDKVKDFTENLFKASAKDPKKPIVLYIDSYGGSVDALSAMVAAIDAIPNKVITVAMGKAMSCGAMLLSYGDIRYAAPHARMMVHEISAGGWGNINDLKTSASESARMNTHWMSWLAENCGLRLKELLKKFTNKRRDIYLTPSEATKFGLTDKVGIPKVKKIVRFEIHD